VNKFFQVRRPEAEFRGPNMGNEFGAGAEFRPIELFAALIPSEMFRVGFREEGALVMVEPPSQPGAAGILEVNDHVLFAVKDIFVEELARAMHQTAVTYRGPGIDALLIETRENRG
jgi:hypothetical protein